MDKKRKRDDNGGSTSGALVKVEHAAAALLACAREWKDACGAAFDIEHKISKETDRVLVKIGFFDELTCKQLSQLRDVELPGDFVLADLAADLGRNCLVATVVRSGRGRAFRPSDTGVASPRANGAYSGDAVVESLKLRVSFNVKEADAPALQTLISSVVRSFPANEVKLTKIAQRPELYVMTLAVSGERVPDAALRLAADHEGVVHFGGALLTLVSPKLAADIPTDF